MATDKEKLEQLAAQDAANLLLQNTPQGPAKSTTAAPTAVPYSAVDPSAITQSFYTKATSKSNYLKNRPVYVQSDAVKAAAAELTSKEGAKPGPYQSVYGDQIQELLNKALNRDPFRYDFASDPMYQQYSDKYQQMGKMAMRDTMGQATALTGGYGNSYSQAVGQQTYQQYLTALNDMLPELRNASYQQYQDEGNRLQQNLSMLQGQDATDYGKYRDTVTDYQTELAYFRSKYQDMSDAEYNRYLNDLTAWQADRDFWYKKEQDDWAKEQMAKAGGGGRGGGGGNKDTLFPSTYDEYIALTGDKSIMTQSEWYARKSNSPSAAVNYASYQDYLKAMFAKNN